MSINPLSRQISVGRAVLWVFLGLTAGKVWLNVPSVDTPAQAQIPDSGAQLNALIAEAQKTNGLLTQIVDTLSNRTIKVRMAGADNTLEEPTPKKPR